MSNYAYCLTEEQSYEASLRRVFVGKRADYIVITSRREVFQINAVNFGIGQGWLVGQWDESDVQSTAFVCRLTSEGRQYFGLETEVALAPGD